MATGRTRAHEVLALDSAAADPASPSSCDGPSSAGGSSGTTKSSRTNSAWDHFEGRGWRGFHHHGALCIAAYAFLVAERATLFPPSRWPSSTPLAFPKISSRGALPVRPERHVPASIATMHQVLARALLQGQPCHWCGRHPRPRR